MELATTTGKQKGCDVKYLLLTLISFISAIAFGQPREAEIWNPPIGEDRFLITFNTDGWLNTPDGIELRPYSLGIESHIMYDYQFGKSIMSFSWGYGFSSHNVHHNGFFAADTTNNQLTRLYPFEKSYNYIKNKLHATYLEVPLELRLRTRGETPFKLYLGAKVGYLVNIHSKTKDYSGKTKFYGLENVMNLRYGVTAKIGYNAWTISGFYSLTPLISEGGGDRLIPYSLGISFFLL